ncbi:MAG: hypothetical protein INQ03_04865 [Candidatus Heimdallarchaeota archaeon]|nr:hypothetical protein [Candidatus Heimdallarchaeota archaeon]
MDNFAVLGLGMMGKAICFDLINNTDAHVYGFELFEKRREELTTFFPKDRFTALPLQLELEKTSDLPDQFAKYGIKVVFGAIDYKFNAYLTKICIDAQVNFLDLGGNPDIVHAQHAMTDRAKEEKVTIIPDCGLAPGMANVLAAGLMYEMDELDSCKIRVGGLPQHPKTILNYQQVFSIRGLTNEYLEDAEVIRDRKLIKVSSLTELEEVSFESQEFPKLEAFQTAGGTSSLPSLFENQIQSLDYKTIRYAGHCQFIQFLKEFGLLSSEPYKNTTPREVVEYCLQKTLPQQEPDLVLVKVEVKGKVDNLPKTVIFEIIDHYDQNTGFSSMARTTAFPISILGIMIADGRIHEFGVVPGERVTPHDDFISELAKRNIKINRIERQ